MVRSVEAMEIKELESRNVKQNHLVGKCLAVYLWHVRRLNLNYKALEVN